MKDYEDVQFLVRSDYTFRYYIRVMPNGKWSYCLISFSSFIALEEDNGGAKEKSTEKEGESSPATSLDGDDTRDSTTDGKNATVEKKSSSKVQEPDEQEEGESEQDDKSNKVIMSA